MYCASSPQSSTDCRNKSVVFLVDNDKIVRSKLREQFNNSSLFRVAGEASYSAPYTDDLFDISPNVVVFSSFCGSKEQYGDIKKIHTDMPLVKKFVLSSNIDEAEFCTTVISGVKGYCSLNCESWELLRAIRIVAGGGAYYDINMSNFIYRLISHMNQLRQLPIDKPVEEQFNLTEREMDVIMVAPYCDDYDEIAQKLCISKHTVKMHLTSIYRKLGVKNKLQAILKLQNRIYEFKF